MCKNGYDTRFSTEVMDLMLSYCDKYVSKLQEAADADEDTYTNGERLLISAADIQRGLVPKIKALMDENDPSDEGAAEIKKLLNGWLGIRHRNFLTKTEARDKDFEDYLRDNSRGRLRSEAAEFASIVKLFKKLTLNTLLVA